MPPNRDGQWSAATRIPVPVYPLVDNERLSSPHAVVGGDHRGLMVIHAILLRTGKVLWFCGHVESVFYPAVCYVFDPKNPTATLTPIRFPSNMDLFCCHYVQIPDGRILVFGGSDPNFVAHSSVGARNICIFDPMTESWSVSRTGGSTNALRQGRWYPTAVVLGDGRVAVFSGRREHPSDTLPTEPGPVGAAIADKVEILSPPNWAPTELSGATFALPIYPGVQLAPNGRIYFCGPNWGQEIPNPDTRSIAIPAGATSASWTPYAGLRPAQPRREEGSCVILPPAQDGKILVIGGSVALDSSGNPLVIPGGGGPSAFDHIANATDPLSAEIMDTTTNPPTWSATPGRQMSFGRTNGHCVLLPDETVLVLGGHNRYKWLSVAGGTNPSLTAEIFTPRAGPDQGFRPAAQMNRPRMYHSTALLLPDGRVLVAGGANANDIEPGFDGVNPPSPAMYPAGWTGPTYGPGQPLNEKTYEFYEPPYCFMPNNAARPTITNVKRGGNRSRQVGYGQTFTVETPNAAAIDKVAFMRPGAVTHHTDSEQRYVRLTFTRASATELTVTAVSDPNVAPPGYYMLWIIDNAGRPCQETVFVQLTRAMASSSSSDWCFIATAALGSTLHPQVDYLRRLRSEIAGANRLGGGFIQAVNRIYYSFSPRLAAFLIAHPALVPPVRSVVIYPTIQAIRLAERTARPVRHKQARYALLILLLTLFALLAVACAPVAAVLLLGRLALDRVRAAGVSNQQSAAEDDDAPPGRERQR